MDDTPVPQLQPFPSSTINIDGVPQRIFENITQSDWASFLTTVEQWWNIYSVIALFVSFLFFSGFVYAKIHYNELSEMEQEKLREAEAEWKMKHEHPESKNARWEIIQKRVADMSPESWRVAVIEADILLDETLTNAGFVGQSIGEKLKTANPQSFTTLQDAWSAHKVRNEIAHVGSDFILTKKVAQETITRFERVFREFGVI